MEQLTKQLDKVKQEVKKVIIGKDEVINSILMTMMAGGHVLLEDIPGVGKTTMALAFSKALSLEYHRMQFTPDVLPADVSGFSMFNKDTQQFEYREGAVFCNLFLADEINRTSPKTQSALLEVMEEGKATVDGVTRSLPQPFFVIATQNPLGSAGTQKLPESQLDRFMTRLSMGYPDRDSEVIMLKAENRKTMDDVEKVMSLEDVMKAQELISNVHVEDTVYGYIADLVKASRSNDGLKTGISPRGAKSMLRMARSCAFLEGRDYVVPEDVVKVFYHTGEHRVTLSVSARAEGKTEHQVLEEVVRSIPMPGNN